MQYNVLKFGGTSMKDHQTWKKVLEIINGYEYPVVVVSATARTTRQLVQSAKLAGEGKLNEALEISGEISGRHIDLVRNFLEENESPKNELILESCTRKVVEKEKKLNKLLGYIHKQGKVLPQMHDAVASIGEQISSYLFAQCGLALGMMTQHIEARKLIKTDAEYGKANPNSLQINQRCGSLETVMENGFIPVIGGFYGEAPDKTITTLGFEGSDYTASLIGAAVNAETIEIWTDVSGVYTSDPRYIEDARPLKELSYFEATEMAYFGARVLHPSTLKPAQERNIPVHVKNMFRPEDPGTVIVRESSQEKEFLALSFKDNMATLTVSAYETVMGYQFLTQVFTVLQNHRIPVDAVNTTEASVTIALEDSEILDLLSAELIETGHVNLQRNRGLISIIGCTLSDAQSLREKIFGGLGECPLDLVSYSREKRIFNLVTTEDKLTETAGALHRQLFS